jgi:hypothetical protein
MSFISPNTARLVKKWDPLGAPINAAAYSLFGKGLNKPGPPGPPNPNDAANASRTLSDQMRLRRGMLANIFAGSTGGTPAVGKTSLGTGG